MMDRESTEQDLQWVLRVLRARLLWILVPAMIFNAVFLGMALRETPLYSSTTELLVQARSTESSASGVANANDAVRNSQRVLATELKVLLSESVAVNAIKVLGYEARVTGSVNADSDILRVTATDPDPRKAARISTVFADEYVKLRKNQSVADLNDATKQLQAKAVEYQQQIDAIDAEITALSASEGGLSPADLQARLNTRQLIATQLQTYKNRIDSFEIDATLKSGGARVISPAAEADTPISPKPLRSAVLGLILGLMVGAGLALLIERLDDRIRNRDSLAEAAGGLPILSMVPRVRSWRNKRTTQIVSQVDPMSIGAETYRSLRTSLQFMGVDSPIRVIQVASANPGEGKSTTAANLATVFAQAGQRVVIIDCDLRRPRMHEFFAVSNDRGFTTIALGETTVEEASWKVDDKLQLLLVPSGPKPPNPAELLASERFATTLESIKESADILILDGPPVLAVTDPIIISRLVDATIVVVKSNSTHRKHLQSALAALRQANANIAGLVLNDIDRGAQNSYGGYGNYGGYAYGEDRKPRRSKKDAEEQVRNRRAKRVSELTPKVLRNPKHDTEPAAASTSPTSSNGTSTVGEMADLSGHNGETNARNASALNGGASRKAVPQPPTLVSPVTPDDETAKAKSKNDAIAQDQPKKVVSMADGEKVVSTEGEPVVDDGEKATTVETPNGVAAEGGAANGVAVGQVLTRAEDKAEVDAWAPDAEDEQTSAGAGLPEGESGVLESANGNGVDSTPLVNGMRAARAEQSTNGQVESNGATKAWLPTRGRKRR